MIITRMNITILYVMNVKVSSDVAPNIVQKTEEELGFIVKKHDIIFNGICRDCLEKIKESN